MFFKNAIIYRLTERFELTADQLSEKLGEFCFHPCGSLDPVRYGFVSPLGGDGDSYVVEANGCFMICARRQQKILPGQAISESLEEKVKAIIAAENRPVLRKEREVLRDEIIFSMLPKAFTRSSLDYAYISPGDGLIVVNSASVSRAEDLISKLREALGSLRCLPLSVKSIPAQVMTHWISEIQAPNQFEMGDDVVLEAKKDGRIVHAKKQDLTAAEIRNHINSGMIVNRVSIVWREAIHCTVGDDLKIKRLKFCDAITEKADAMNPESKAEQFKADFSVMTIELKHFIAALLDAFGGVQIE